MSNFFKIKDKLYLVEKPIQINEVPKDSEPTQHIWIYDRSYSMSYDLPYLTDNLVEKVKEIPSGDTITLGWFSGEGDFNFILKGFKITDNSDYSIVEKAINKNKSPISCTCFSEILSDTATVIEDLSVISNRFSFMLHTDGYPVVSNYSKEIESIFMAIEKIEGKITSSCLIGYGNYYNRDLIMEMAESFGGSLIHSDDIPQFSLAISDLIEKSSGSETKIKVKINNSSDLIFSMFGNTLSVYKQKEDGSINFIPTSSDKTDFVYFLTDSLNGDEKEVVLKKTHLTKSCKESSMVSAVYASACLLNQKTKTGEALEAVASIGDKHFVNLLTNAFTNSEHGNAEAALREAMANSQKRITEGFDKNYLPPSDAFCLLDMLEVLMKDDESFFYPYNPNFKYKRIGTKSKVIGKYPDFKPEDNVKCKLSDLAWNKTKLNLSLRATIFGTINLKQGFKKLGLNKTYPTHIFRNYTLVKDGVLNMTTLPISMSKNSFNYLKKEGLFSEYSYEEGHIFDLPLNAIPVMNRAIAEGKTSAAVLGSDVQKQLQLEATMKVLKGIKKDIEGDKTAPLVGLSDEQVSFLEENGITKNGFSPKTEKEAPVDFYYAKEFKVSVKGISSFPKVADVQKKITANKSLTPREEMIKEGLDLFEASPVNSSSDKVKLAWLEDTMNNVKSDLLSTRFDIQKTKFSIILGKKWLDEFENRDNCKLEVNGKIVTFEITEKKVNY